MKLSLKNTYFPSKNKQTTKAVTLEHIFGYKNSSLVILKEDKESGNIVELSPEDELVMKKMSVATDVKINGSVPLEEDSEPQSMSSKGFEYEKIVINSLKQAKANGNITDGAGACAVCPDADINIYGNIFNVEIKLNKNAQMGGGSLRFTKEGDISFSQKELEDSTKEMLAAAVQQNADRIKNLLEFLNAQEPKNVNSVSTGFPGTWTKEAWVKANKAGKLFNIREAAKVSTDHLANHYAKKGVYYIQIGGAGLFYLADNPAGLPVPKLQGEMNIEMGTRPAGSRVLKNGLRVVGAGIRVQGRLKTKNKSPYTLDDPLSVQKLLKAVGAGKKPGKKQQQKVKKPQTNKRPELTDKKPVDIKASKPKDIKIKSGAMNI